MNNIDNKKNVVIVITNRVHDDMISTINSSQWNTILVCPDNDKKYENAISPKQFKKDLDNIKPSMFILDNLEEEFFTSDYIKLCNQTSLESKQRTPIFTRVPYYADFVFEPNKDSCYYNLFSLSRATASLCIDDIKKMSGVHSIFYTVRNSDYNEYKKYYLAKLLGVAMMYNHYLSPLIPEQVFNYSEINEEFKNDEILFNLLLDGKYIIKCQIVNGNREETIHIEYEDNMKLKTWKKNIDTNNEIYEFVQKFLSGDAFCLFGQQDSRLMEIIERQQIYV